MMLLRRLLQALGWRHAIQPANPIPHPERLLLGNALHD